ncbi:MAG: hypothetical protein C5B50_07505 [Verrucomicrobia bacterium]|nr:MAG: hypothetical protein C5B50_07505 [Verrucomicrobiota bacterium]
MRCTFRLFRHYLLGGLFIAALHPRGNAGEASAVARSPAAVPTLEEALAARTDVWGLAAMSQSNGPSYKFFADLLPPLLYVNAAFHYYPIVLSAPNNPQKARLVSNGSALNARANLKTWKEIGTPVTFRVGTREELFGDDLKRLNGPHLEHGYLPVVKLSYQQDSNTYEEESFAAVTGNLASNGVVFVRFGCRPSLVVPALTGSGEGSGSARPNIGEVSAQFEVPGRLKAAQGTIQNPNGHVIAWFDKTWQWVPEKNALVARFGPGSHPRLAFAIKSMRIERASNVSAAMYESERKLSIRTWQKILDRGTQIAVPEPLVNDAWRALIISLFSISSNHHPNYSAGNQYDRLYQAECGDTARALLLWGQENETARMIPSLLDYTRDKLRFHNAGFKLQLLAHYYWLTRDTNFLNSVRAKWEPELKNILEGREAQSGLFPREQYCGDIFKDVYSLNSDAAAWRGLRDFAAVLSDRKLLQEAAQFRKAILSAVEKSERKDVQPPFIPIALFGEEPPYDPLTGSMRGGYWDLMAPYVLGSGVFGFGSAGERAILDYLQERGGICMGMIRFDQHSGLYANGDALDDLYGLRYSLKLLELDEVDDALVSFYGKLAQGLTRETFVGAEGTGLRPLDEFGRPMYLPPNSTAQAVPLWLLRYLLIQDWDMDDDGVPDTLRLAFATPRTWLADGNRIKIENAPTAFGPVSMNIVSRLARGEVVAHIHLPSRNPPAHTFLRIRLPDGWHPTAAKCAGRSFPLDGSGAIDISSLRGSVMIHFRVKSAG